MMEDIKKINEIINSEDFKTGLSNAISYGSGTDWHANEDGEEYEVDTFSLEDATGEAIEYLLSKFKQ